MGDSTVYGQGKKYDPTKPRRAAQICINVLYGASSVQEDDKRRAEDAAFAILGGLDPEAAHAEYQRQWAEFDNEEPMTGLARTWIEATKAADIALTTGWHNPAGASCSLSV